MAKFRFKRRNGTVILSDSTVSEKKLNLFKKMKGFGTDAEVNAYIKGAQDAQKKLKIKPK